METEISPDCRIEVDVNDNERTVRIVCADVEAAWTKDKAVSREEWPGLVVGV